jgi:murein DD-endopeptidase MepM/ murein hydrolase activator NlpD
MKVLIISSKNATHKQIELSMRHIMSLFILLSVLVIVISLLYQSKINQLSSSLNPGQVVSPQLDKKLPTSQNTDLSDDVNYYAQRLGLLQAESIRLKAIAEKMAEQTGVDISIYDLSAEPAQGGLDSEGETINSDDLQNKLDELSTLFDQQSEQLSLLEDVYLVRESITSAIPQGSPVPTGWISSGYGYRTDPFNGKRTMHKGIDIAGKSGSEILAVADGIVMWTGRKHGYGKMIDIDHGNGYISRYAHNKKLIVTVGDRIKKGDVIALMGSTGRSTGPHVHFEILRDGKVLNPYNFVKS